MAQSITLWDRTTPLNNGNADSGINWLENQAPSTVNNSARAMMERLAEFYYDDGAVNTVAGTGDAITVTVNDGLTAYITGHHFRFVASAANTTNVTVNVNAIGAKAIRKTSGGTDVALVAGDLAAGETYFVIYRATANAAAGAYVIIGAAAVAAASTAQAGIVQLATIAEDLAGTSTTKVVTPAGLAGLLYAGTDNAGSATITMGDGGYFNLITSTTAITAFAFTTDAVGRTAKVRFNTVRTLTHNGTSLIIPGAANITTAVGDIAQVRSLGSGNFVVEWYTRASGSDITLGTSIASTSGTALDFTGIPSWVNEITVEFVGVSTNGSSNYMVQMGSGSVQTSGYLGAAGNTGGTANFTTGFGAISGAGTVVMHGIFLLRRVTGNTWAASHGMGRSDAASISGGGGSVTLSGAVDRIRVTAVNGTDTFDAGTVNISYQ